MSQIQIVTSPTCNFCHAAKKIFDQHNIDYQEFDLLNDNAHAQQLMFESGQRTVPQIFINNQPIGGFTELTQLIKNNELNLTEVTAI